MGVTGAVTAGAAVAGAGASVYGAMKGSDAASSAADSSNENAQNNAMLNMNGFYASKQTLEEQAQKAREAYYVARQDQNTAGQAAIGALQQGTGYWNDAYNQGRGDLTAGLNEWDNKYNQVRADESGYMNLGQQGLTGYSGLLNDPSSITSNPGYQFRLNQGVQGLDRSAASKGKLFSGAQGKAVTEYGQNYATSEYDKALARYKSAIDVGQTSTGRVDQAGMTTAAGKGSLYNSLANLATSRAQGLNQNAAQQAGVYQGWGDDMYNIANSWATNENNLAKNTVDAWQNASGQTTSSNTANTTSANQADVASASATNKGIEGAANSLNSGVSNYLKSQSNNSSYDQLVSSGSNYLSQANAIK